MQLNASAHRSRQPLTATIIMSRLLLQMLNLHLKLQTMIRAAARRGNARVMVWWYPFRVFVSVGEGRVGKGTHSECSNCSSNLCMRSRHESLRARYAFLFCQWYLLT